MFGKKYSIICEFYRFRISRFVLERVLISFSCTNININRVLFESGTSCLQTWCPSENTYLMDISTFLLI